MCHKRGSDEAAAHLGRKVEMSPSEAAAGPQEFLHHKQFPDQLDRPRFAIFVVEKSYTKMGGSRKERGCPR